MPALKAVIDTSVMVSVALPKGGLARELRDLIAEGGFTLVTSQKIMAELYWVLHYPRILKQFQPKEGDINEFIGMVMEKALITKGRYKLDKITDDPTNNMFLACALEANTDYIVSGDKHRRNPKQYQGIKIITVKGIRGKGVKGKRARIKT